jgi:hypothetical protein
MNLIEFIKNVKITGLYCWFCFQGRFMQFEEDTF